MSNFIKKKHSSHSGIVYTFSRKDTDEVAAGLEERGISALTYHAGLSVTQRNRAQERWMKNDTQVSRGGEELHPRVLEAWLAIFVWETPQSSLLYRHVSFRSSCTLSLSRLISLLLFLWTTKTVKVSLPFPHY